MEINEIIVIEIIRNNYSKIKSDSRYIERKFDFEKIIQILCNQKIFMLYYKQIIAEKLFPNYDRDIRAIALRKQNKKNCYIRVLYQIVRLLNESKIDYVIYKGHALECLLYSDNPRMYSDIDVFLPKFSDFEIIKKKLYENFKVHFDDSDDNNLSIGEYKIELLFDDVIYCVEFKTPLHFVIPSDGNYCNISIFDESYNTFSINTTFANLLLYYYRFTEETFFFGGTNRYILQYIVDIKNFLDKYFNSIDWAYIYKSLDERGYIKALPNVYEHLYAIYSDEILKYKKCFFAKAQCRSFKSICDVPILVRFFNSLEVLEYTRKYCRYKFFNYSRTIGKKIKDLSDTFYSLISLRCKARIDDKTINLTFNIDDFSNKIIHIQLYYFNNYEFVDPYRSFVINCLNNPVVYRMHISRKKNTLSKQFGDSSYLYDSSCVIIEKSTHCLTLVISLDAFKIDIKKSIAVNYAIYNVEEKMKMDLIAVYRPVWHLPIVIN